MLKLILIALALTALSAATFFEEASHEAEADGAQPFRFSHKLHMEQDLTCVECHLNAQTGAVATLPPTRVCLLCHEEAQGEDPDEPRVREYAELGDYIPWVIVNQTAGHVYFSHEAHVTWGAMDCDTCHGDVGSATETFTASQTANLTMGVCMDCHVERGANNDCIACHK